MREVYGIDLTEIGARPWWWTRGHVLGLVSRPAPTRLQAWVASQSKEPA